MHLAHWTGCCIHWSHTVSGEVMGPVTSAVLNGTTLQHLILIPTGCGEQTLSKLGIMVYVGKYLKETGQMTGQTERKIYDYTRRGVEHAMQYQKPGGGFSVWSWTPPRIFLTAFATKIFSQAREFNALDNVPSDVICNATEWVTQRQNANGGYQVQREQTKKYWRVWKSCVGREQCLKFIGDTTYWYFRPTGYRNLAGF